VLLDTVLESLIDVRIERPPLLWHARADPRATGELLEEMIAAGARRNGGRLDRITVNASNIVVEPGAADPLPEGELVAITVSSGGDWAPEATWAPGTSPLGSFGDESIETLANSSGAVYGYTRVLSGESGSVTILFEREST
jgi:hypothetical protein